jgi:two-component system response regulator GlrR
MPILTFRERMRRAEEDLVLHYLELAWGNVAEAARLAGMDRGNFSRLVQKHRIDPNVFKRDRVA